MKNKRIDIRIDPETEELLTSLCLRFNDNKSGIIRKALKCLAGKNKHYITIGYFEGKEPSKQINNQVDETNQETSEEQIQLNNTLKRLKITKEEFLKLPVNKRFEEYNKQYKIDHPNEETIDEIAKTIEF